MLLLCSRCGKVVILNVFTTDISAFFKLCSWCFQEPSGDSGTRISPNLRLQFISENASLLFVFVPPPKVPLH